jgi:hypothetical protein
MSAAAVAPLARAVISDSTIATLLAHLHLEPNGSTDSVLLAEKADGRKHILFSGPTPEAESMDQALRVFLTSFVASPGLVAPDDRPPGAPEAAMRA